MNHSLPSRLLAFGCTALFASLAAASGGAGTNYGAMWNDNKPKSGQPFGCVAGSLGRVKGSTSYYSLKLRLRKEGVDKESQTVTVIYTEGALDHHSQIKDGPEMRDVFHTCLRPGRYTLLGFQLVEGITYFNQPREYAIPIDVKAGETTYIGSYIGYLQGDASNCGLPAKSTRVEARDREEADLALIRPMAEKAGHSIGKQLPDWSGAAPLLLVCPAAPPAA